MTIHVVDTHDAPTGCHDDVVDIVRSVFALGGLVFVGLFRLHGRRHLGRNLTPDASTDRCGERLGRRDETLPGLKESRPRTDRTHLFDLEPKFVDRLLQQQLSHTREDMVSAQYVTREE